MNKSVCPSGSHDLLSSISTKDNDEVEKEDLPILRLEVVEVRVRNLGNLQDRTQRNIPKIRRTFQTNCLYTSFIVSILGPKRDESCFAGSCLGNRRIQTCLRHMQYPEYRFPISRMENR